MQRSHRYEGLDAMRGIGAIAVLQFHASGVLPIAQSGYLAVDFFFALSGFVISLAYEPKLRAGLRTHDFFLARVRRLYPLYAVGILLGALVLGRIVFNGDETIKAFVMALAFNALMLPVPIDAPNYFPLNHPSWTLFFEMLINVAFAAIAAQLTTRLLLVMILALGIALTASILNEDMLGGWNWATFHIGLLRVAFSFSVGVAMARLSKAPIRSAYALIPIGLLIAMLYLPHSVEDTAILAIPSILFVSPLILWMGTRLELPVALAPIGVFLGALSYPLYVVHSPLLGPTRGLIERVGMPPLMNMVALTLVMMAVAYVVNAAISWLLARRFKKSILQAR